MAISKARQRFRIFLGVLLVLSFGFFGTTAYFYIQIKQKNIKILDIAPTLFAIDIYKDQIHAYFTDQDSRFEIGTALCRKGFFHSSYGIAGMDMLKKLADEGHAPSQFVYAQLLLQTSAPTLSNQIIVMNLYRQSAHQGYQPAIEQLAMLEQNNP